MFGFRRIFMLLPSQHLQNLLGHGRALRTWLALCSQKRHDAVTRDMGLCLIPRLEIHLSCLSSQTSWCPQNLVGEFSC
jgi:hypothetical protein